MTKQFIRKLRSLTVFDYLIGLTAFVLVGCVFMYFSTKTEYTYIELTPQSQEWSVDEPPPVYQETDAIRNGDAVYNSLGQQMAKVVDVATVNFGGTKRFLKIIIQLKAKYNPRTKIYSFNDTPLLIGNLLSLSLGQVSFRGKILNIYTNPADKNKNYTLRNIIATVLFRQLEPTHAETIKTFEAKNSKGEIVAKTLSADIRPAEMDVQTDKGVVYHGYSTIYKDATLRLLLPNVPCANDTCFFNDTIDLKIGIKYFWIHANTTLLSGGVITNLEYPDNPAQAGAPQ